MRRSYPATAQPHEWRGIFRRLQNQAPIVTLVAFSLFSVGSVADVTIGNDRKATIKMGSQSWLEQELATFRKYPFIERAERLIGAGQSVEAAIELARVLAMYPDDVDVRLRLIVLLLEPLDELRPAAEHASKLIEQGRKPGLGYHYRALATLRLGDADSAAADWRRALETQELGEDLQRYIRRQLADIAIQRGDFAAIPPLLEEDAADQVFEDRLRLVQAYLKLDRPKDATQMLMLADAVPSEGWLSIAQLLVDMGQPTLAAETITRGLEREESAVIRRELTTFLGYLHMQRGEPEQGAQAFALAAQEGEPDTELYLAWAQALTESRLAAQALDVVETVEQTSPYGRRLHAQLLAELGRPEDAARVLKQLLDDPSQQEDPGAIALEIAELHAQAGDPAAQMTALEHAVSLSPDHAPALRALAERQVGDGRLSAASDTLRHFIIVEDRPEGRLRLVDVLLALGEHQAALIELRLLAERLPSGHPERIRVLRQWASLAEAEQEWDEAARAWEALVLADSSKSPEYLLHAGRAARLGRQPVRARQILAKLDVAAQDSDIRALFFEEQAQLALIKGDHMTAAQWQQQAVNAHPTAARHYHMAQVWKTLHETDLARRALEQATILAPKNAEYQASLGYDYLEAGNDSRAAEYFETALTLDPDRLSLYEELGYVFRRLGRNEDEAEQFGELIRRQAEGGQPRSALARVTGSDTESVTRFKLEQVQALRRAGKREQALDVLESSDDLPLDGTQLKVQLLKEAGRFEDAEQALAQVKEEELTLADRALLYEERARLASMNGDARRAAEAQRRSVLTEPTADRHYSLAEYLLELGEQADARSEFQQAVLLAPDNPDFQASLAYAHLRAGDDDLAAGHFQAALAADRQRLPLYEELGFAYRRLGQDEAAAQAFRQRIDLAQTGEAGTDESGYPWRREVQQLEDRLRVNAGVFVRRMNGDSTSDPDAPVGLSGFQSQAGVDIAYRLDNVSDGRFVEVYGRSIWAFEDDTLSPEGSQTQGGVGLRVKPFAPVNFFLSGERLVALGSEARNDWMVRASASFDRGSAYAPDQQYQHYRSVYLDAAMVLEDSAEFLVGEWREGVAIGMGQGLNLVPYGIAAASYTDDAETERRYELGIGVALRGWFGGNAYHTHSSNIELGLEFRGMVGGNTDEDSGVVVRLQYGF